MLSGHRWVPRLRARRSHPSSIDHVESQSPYRDMSHVMGSDAIVECLSSVAHYILTDQRSSMSPEMLEVILYLNFNRDMWDVSTVAEAHTLVRNKDRDERLAKKLEAIKLYNVDSDESDSDMEEVES